MKISTGTISSAVNCAWLKYVHVPSTTYHVCNFQGDLWSVKQIVFSFRQTTNVFLLENKRFYFIAKHSFDGIETDGQRRPIDPVLLYMSSKNPDILHGDCLTVEYNEIDWSGFIVLLLHFWMKVSILRRISCSTTMSSVGLKNTFFFCYYVSIWFLHFLNFSKSDFCTLLVV